MSKSGTNSLRMSQEEFLEKCLQKGLANIDYSEMVYEGCRKPITIRCVEHGYFTLTPWAHIQSKIGCKNCYWEAKALSQVEFIDRCQCIHNSEYDYSLVNYTGKRNKVDIICIKHGVFSQEAGHHMYGATCPKCNNKSLGERHTISILDQMNVS